MGIAVSIQSVLSLFFLVLTGFVVAKKKLVTEKFSHDLSQFLFYVSIPCTMIHSIAQKFSEDTMRDSIKMLVYGTLFVLIGAIFAKLLSGLFCEKDIKKRTVYEFTLTIPNYGFMGWPICQTFFGDEGLFFSSVFGMPMNVLFYIYGQFVFGRIQGTKGSFQIKSFLNPPVLGTFAGMVLFLTGIELPSALDKSIELLGNTTTPLSMAVAGMMLATCPIGAVLKEKRVFFYSLLRLLILPLLAFIVFKMLGESGMMLAIPVTIAAMPAPANVTVLTEKYGGDSVLGAQLIFVSTLLSVITIPVIMAFL